MAYEGELVRMENGRWAQFQRCDIYNRGHQDGDEMSILVAVELGEHFQDLLNAAEASLSAYREKGIPIHFRLDPNGKGTWSVSFEPPVEAVPA
jgi:hypothetical protein